MAVETHQSEPTRGSFIHSIFIKCLALVAVSCIVVAGILTYKNLKTSQGLASQAMLDVGEQVVEQLSQRAGPALNFKDYDRLNAIMTDTVDAKEGSAAGAIVLSQTGDMVASSMLDGLSPDLMVALAREVLEDGEPRINPERLIIARPVFGGADQNLVGVVALDWQSAVLFAEAQRQMTVSLLLAMAVVVGMLVVASPVVKRVVAKPLLAIADATNKMSSGDLECDVPQFKAGNEISPVSRALTAFQAELKATEAARQDSTMKSTALDAGSAAIMIADADFKITYASTAVLELLKDKRAVISARIPGFDAENIVGQSIDIFHKKPDMQRKMLAALGPDGHHANLEMDDVTLELKISRIDGESGDRIGYVVEWADVSEQRLNAAVLESLNDNQARAEFGPDGQLVDANAAFMALVGVQSVSDTCRFAETVFVDQDPADPSHAMFGELTIRGTDGSVSHLLGGLSPVTYNNGDLKRTVLIAADVTTEHKQKRTASEERARLQAAQDQMIAALSNALAVLAEGDLTVRINEEFSGSNDQIRQDFNTALERLDDAIDSVVAGANEIHSEVTGVAGAATSLSKRTESQAATLEETAAAVTEISASVTNSADGARSANQVVKTAEDNAKSSGKVVHEAVTAMGDIAKSSAEISSIIKVIDDIAFQTNLLALNAGVEAARAGDAGRGFAVVASEVRALAQRSSEAANEIGSLISASSENVDLGVKLVGSAGEALQEIITSISDISSYVSQIASASEEQSSSVAEISAAMNQLDQVTQENAAMFEETTAASQNLSRVANDLTARVQRFSTRSQSRQDDQDVMDGSEQDSEMARWA
ncbi:methyl-accepting chemotaxis protein [uncultured Roseobacter sp.]|uniref:methyl-accepting chemotaxis protein n=1 Tax=uncultured Roseobacter sp. TaxID=114847 RepID=UPI00262B5423|nr:methyl-accepting chemotaxis protein [uncultured Roseobacter sp.]